MRDFKDFAMEKCVRERWKRNRNKNKSINVQSCAVNLKIELEQALDYLIDFREEGWWLPDKNTLWFGKVKEDEK